MKKPSKATLRCARNSFMRAQLCKQFEAGVRKINTLNAKQQEAFWAGYFGVQPRFYSFRDEVFDEQLSKLFRH